MSKQRAPSSVSNQSETSTSNANTSSETGQSSNAEAIFSLGQALLHDWSGQGATMGTLDSVPASPVEALREAAAGNAIGMVDESNCLALIAAMNNTQHAEVAGDDQLMSQLQIAFNHDELRMGAEVSERKMAERFFEMRFGIELKGRFEDAQGSQTRNADTGPANEGETLITWQHDDILEVWEILATLPDQDVSENTAIKAFEAISGNRGFWSGGPGEVQLGQGLNDDSAERLEHTVRHEIGHAVHDSMESMVDSWLDKEVGFRILGYGRDGCQSLVDSLGGFPPDVDESHVLDLLEQYLSRTSWSTKNPIMADDPEWVKMPDSVKNAAVSSASRWYNQYKQHPSGSEGRVFFNHWYQNTMSISTVAEQAIDATGDTYSAMSPGEFFANCYAEYFGDPAGYTDYSKWGGGLPSSVKSFFRQHILARQPYAAPEDSATISPSETTNNTSGIIQ